jgi:hypothetical protein
VFRMAVFLLVILFLIMIVIYQNYEPFENFQTDYPCRVYLSDNDFLKHMIPHHQIAIDISIQHIENTKNDVVAKILRELIWTQKYEIVMMMEELNSKTTNVSTLFSNKSFIPTTLSTVFPNVIGLTNTYCDPGFFSTKTHNHSSHQMIVTDKQYINHMIPHHQVAVDMCKMLLQHTKSDFLIYLAYRMIRGQESEIILLNDMLQSQFIN